MRGSDPAMSSGIDDLGERGLAPERMGGGGSTGTQVASGDCFTNRLSGSNAIPPHISAFRYGILIASANFLLGAAARGREALSAARIGAGGPRREGESRFQEQEWEKAFEDGE